MRKHKISLLPADSKQRDYQDIKFKLASNFTELLRAFRLVYQEYLKCGYNNPDTCRMRYSLLELLPVSRTFVARCGRQLIGTGTVVFDSEAGFPSNHIFASEFEQMRKSGRKIAEGTQLACVDYKSIKAHQISHELISLGLCWCAINSIDDFCVVVHPKHVGFWQKRLNFEVQSDLKGCSHVKGSPGVLLRFDIRESGMSLAKPSAAFQKLMLNRWLETVLCSTHYILSDQEVTNLLIRQPAIVTTLSLEQRKVLKKYYPGPLEQAERLILNREFKKVA